MGNTVFTFTDIFYVKDDLIESIIKAMTQEEIAIALKGEHTEIRKRFYKNLHSEEDSKELKDEIKHSDAQRPERIKAQEKILALIAQHPDYKNIRFQSRFYSFGDFTDYIKSKSSPEKPYGFASENTPSSSFFRSPKGEQALEEIMKKNKDEEHESFIIPNTNMYLVNYSECPECGKTYSFKKLMHHYMNPKLDPAFKKGREVQIRQDARMFCIKCKKYFLPSLLLVDEIPKNEVQFLGMINTLNAIEDHYETLGYAALTREETNLLKSDGVSTRVYRDLDEEARNDFAAAVFNPKTASQPSKIFKGIRCDIFLKELESRPTLIKNLLQYSAKPEIALNLILGINVEMKDVLFGTWR